MCFSAEASFGAGAVLSIIGVASIKTAKSRSEIIFASIPFIFAIQQVTEGFLWLALSNSVYAQLQQPATYIFLTFAQVVWPIWVPLSMLVLEKDKSRKKIIYVLTGTGLIVSSYLAFCLFTQGVEAEISEHHILYNLQFPVPVVRYFGVLYFVSTVIPSFISGIKKMWILGLCISISYIVSQQFFEHYVISVWCFFAALISGAVFLILRSYHKDRATSA